MKTTRSLISRIVRQVALSCIFVCMILSIGCMTVPSTGVGDAEPARFIHRNCPVERVETEEEYKQAVLNGPTWKGGKVWVMGECTFDSRAIKSWADAQGIRTRIASTAAYVGRHKIANGHWTVIPEGGRYTIDYVEGVGVISRRIRKEDEFVFLDKGKRDDLMRYSAGIAEARGKSSPVRSVDFSIMPVEKL